MTARSVSRLRRGELRLAIDARFSCRGERNCGARSRLVCRRRRSTAEIRQSKISTFKPRKKTTSRRRRCSRRLRSSSCMRRRPFCRSKLSSRRRSCHRTTILRRHKQADEDADSTAIDATQVEFTESIAPDTTTIVSADAGETSTSIAIVHEATTTIGSDTSTASDLTTPPTSTLTPAVELPAARLPTEDANAPSTTEKMLAQRPKSSLWTTRRRFSRRPKVTKS